MKQLELGELIQCNDRYVAENHAWELKFYSADPLHLKLTLIHDNEIRNKYYIIIKLTHEPHSLGNHYGSVTIDDIYFTCFDEIEASEIFNLFSKLYRKIFVQRFYLAFEKELISKVLQIAVDLSSFDIDI